MDYPRMRFLFALITFAGTLAVTLMNQVSVKVLAPPPPCKRLHDGLAKTGPRFTVARRIFHGAALLSQGVGLKSDTPFSETHRRLGGSYIRPREKVSQMPTRIFAGSRLTDGGVNAPSRSVWTAGSEAREV